MAEVMNEATYVKHHKKKIAFLFAAMRHFAKALRDDGWTVRYVTLGDPANIRLNPARGGGGGPAVQPPTQLMISISGPGVPNGLARAAFPTVGASPLPPLAIAPGLEAALRAYLAATPPAP